MPKDKGPSNSGSRQPTPKSATSNPQPPAEEFDPANIPTLDALFKNDPRPYIPSAALKADSDELPTVAELSAAGDLPVYDVDGNAIRFSDLFVGEQYYGQRQLIVFIRNVYCHICQRYVRRLVESVPMDVYFKLPIPTTVTIITCGAPNLLDAYAKQTACPFRIYTDRSRKLYKALGMPLSGNPGPEPEYADGSGVIRTSIESWAEMAHVRPIRDAFRGGNMFQIGGEFLFEEGNPIWCHRMKHMRNHSEMTTIKRILGYEDTNGEAAEASKEAGASLKKK